MTPGPAPSTVSMDKRRLLIVGSGAMACLFAARLSAAGFPVVMLANWVEGRSAIQQHGVRLVEPNGATKAYAVEIYSDPNQLQPIHYAIILVKAWQTERAAAQMAMRLAPDGLALTLQNGIGNQEILEQALGADRVALGTTTLGANLIEPGKVQPAGEGEITLSQNAQLAPLAAWLRAAGFTVAYTSDIEALIWGKLVINASINPLTALLRIENGDLLSRSAAHDLLKTIALEAAAVAQALGVCLPYPDPVQAVEATARRTSANLSSMLQDVLHGRPTEIDVICGAIVQAGERAGIPTPTNRTLWQLLRALQPSGQVSKENRDRSL